MRKSVDSEISPIFEIFLKSSNGKRQKITTFKLFAFLTILIFLAVVLVAVPLYLFNRSHPKENEKIKMSSPMTSIDAHREG